MNESDLLLWGSNVADYFSDPNAVGFVYDDTTFTASWTLATPIKRDNLILQVTNFVAAIDDDQRIADVYQLRLHAVPGDVTGNNEVDTVDEAEVRTRYFTTAANPDGTTPPYSAFHDVDGSGETLAGDFSATRNGRSNPIPAGDPTAPALPAAPTNLAASAVGESQINLTWTDHAADEGGFLIEMSLDGTSFVELTRVASSAGTGPATYVYAEAFANFAHSFRVAAVSAAGHSSFSNTGSATTLPPSPDGLNVEQVNAAYIDLSWEVIAGFSYTLEWRQDGDWNSIGLSGATSYRHNGLTEGKLYEYRMRATSSAGTSEPGEVIEVYTLPVAPSGLTAGLSPTDGRTIDLRWSDTSGGESGFTIEMASPSGDWVTFASAPANATTLSLTGLAAATTYTFRVLAYNNSGNSTVSGSAHATTTGWLLHQEATAESVAQGQKITLGVAGRAENSTAQPPGVHGAALRLAPAASYTISFTPDLHTWDSYTSGGYGGGYWDSFSVSVDDVPYWERTDLPQDPLNLPFVWGGASYDPNYGGTGKENYASARSITLSTADATKPQYLSVVLDTNTPTDADANYPSWGTVTITSAPLPVLPVVWVSASRTQAAEGTTIANAKGQFTFYRDGDASAELVVPYTVGSGAGQATPDADYPALSGTVTFPAGARSVTVEVDAWSDLESEPVEAVHVNLNTPAANATYTLGHKVAAKVDILDEKKYFVYFYGLAGPGKTGDNWLDKLAEVQRDRDYVLLGDLAGGGFAENRGSRALRTLFGQINQDGGRTISAAEAESVDLTVAGWSLGGSQAVNFSYYLSRVGARVADYKLDAAVPVKALVTWDPAVQLRVGPAVVSAAKTLRTVQDNVQKFRNYYQRRTGSTSFQRLDANGAVLGLERHPRSVLDAFIMGNSVPVNLPAGRVQQHQVDVAFANEPEERDRISASDRIDPDPLYNGGGEPRYRLFGNASVRVGVNHGTMTWYAWRRSSNDLA